MSTARTCLRSIKRFSNVEINMSAKCLRDIGLLDGVKHGEHMIHEKTKQQRNTW